MEKLNKINLNEYRLVKVQDDYMEMTTHLEFFSKKESKTVYLTLQYDLIKPENNKIGPVVASNNKYELVLKDTHLYEMIASTNLIRSLSPEYTVEYIFCKYIDCHYSFDFVLRNLMLMHN